MLDRSGPTRRGSVVRDLIVVLSSIAWPQVLYAQSVGDSVRLAADDERGVPVRFTGNIRGIRFWIPSGTRAVLVSGNDAAGWAQVRTANQVVFVDLEHLTHLDSQSGLPAPSTSMPEAEVPTGIENPLQATPPNPDLQPAPDPIRDAAAAEQLTPELASRADRTALRLGYIDYQDNADSAYKALGRYLENRLGREVVVEGFDRYRYEQLALRMGRSASDGLPIDIGVFTPYAFVLAETRVELDLRATYRRKHIPTYDALIVWLASSPYETVDDVVDALSTQRGRRIALVHTNSTSGFQWPRAWLLRTKRIDVTEDIDIVLAGDHTSALDSLYNDDSVIAAAVWDGAFEIYSDTLPDTTFRHYRLPGSIPNDALTLRTDISEAERDSITTAFLDMTRRPEGLALLDGPFDNWIEGWEEASHGDYDDVRSLISCELPQHRLWLRETASTPVEPGRTLDRQLRAALNDWFRLVPEHDPHDIETDIALDSTAGGRWGATIEIRSGAAEPALVRLEGDLSDLPDSVSFLLKRTFPVEVCADEVASSAARPGRDSVGLSVGIGRDHGIRPGMSASIFIRTLADSGHSTVSVDTAAGRVVWTDETTSVLRYFIDVGDRQIHYLDPFDGTFYPVMITPANEVPPPPTEPRVSVVGVNIEPSTGRLLASIRISFLRGAEEFVAGDAGTPVLVMVDSPGMLESEPFAAHEHDISPGHVEFQEGVYVTRLGTPVSIMLPDYPGVEFQFRLSALWAWYVVLWVALAGAIGGVLPFGTTLMKERRNRSRLGRVEPPAPGPRRPIASLGLLGLHGLAGLAAAVLLYLIVFVAPAFAGKLGFLAVLGAKMATQLLIGALAGIMVGEWLRRGKLRTAAL